MSLLDDITVLLCSHDLVATNIGVRLSQLGARVIRVVNRCCGDELKNRSYYGQFYGDTSILYHSKTHATEIVEVNNILQFRELFLSADVVVYNYNINIFSTLSIDIDILRRDYPNNIYAEYSDYGSHTLDRNKLGDDLLIQAYSGITWLTGDRDDAPTPMGFKAASQFCASYLTQGVFALLYRRESKGIGGKVSTSLLESIIQIQMEVITTSANSGMVTPPRAKHGNAHAGLPAPYGVYRSKDGYFAMSMISIPYLAKIMGLKIPEEWIDRAAWLWYRDDIMAFFAKYFLKKSNREWLELFTPLDVWCSDILDLPSTLDLEAYKILDIERQFKLDDQGASFITTKCPYKIEINPCKLGVKKEGRSTSPLDGLLVVDISQYLSGPTSTLELGDFGATVIKVERPNGGDSGRTVIVNNLFLDETSSSFLTVGRNKRSIALDIKDDEDRNILLELLKQADVVVQNFRPSVMERLGLNYEKIRDINPSVIYAEISGYGESGCWVTKPGQDYIVQALSGLCSVSGERHKAPIPIGLSVVDLISGCHVDEAITVALYNRERSGAGARVKVTMFESAMDLQSDFITAYRWCERDGVLRSRVANSHAGEDAPYGIYATKDGYIAISSAPLDVLIEGDMPFLDESMEWDQRQDIIKKRIAGNVINHTTQYWIDRLSATPSALYGEVLNWKELFSSKRSESLEMLQEVVRGNGFHYTTTRCPVRFDDTIMTYAMGAPRVGEYTQQIIDEYNLKPKKYEK